jgi:tRNA nucleotidyltransferase (CCA-adding enzyme)
MSEEFEAVVARVRDRVTPTPAERDRLDSAIADLKRRARRATAEVPVETEVVLAGSTARDTWLAGDRDVDLFVRFPPDLDRERLEEYGLQVGHAVLPDGHEEYAEHPYVVGEYDGFDVDLVPCYAVEDAAAIRSAVDRTPFHSQYLEARVDADLAGEIRVCKQFLAGIGVYGSDLRTRGFSGFLTELLVLEHGGFGPLVEAAADWHPPLVFDPEDHGEGEPPGRSRGDAGADPAFDAPLIVVDPTDPGRNVAAVCTAANVARLQHYARDLHAQPREELFESAEPEPLTPDGVRAAIDDRGTTPVCVRFEAPDIVTDQLWPQLDRSLGGIEGELDRRGFDVLRAAAFADTVDRPDGATGDAALLFELAVVERPVIERHEGPPVHAREHAGSFYRAYEETDAYGPFIEGDRYVVERDREYPNAPAFLESDAIFDVALGAHVESALDDGYGVLVGEETTTLAAAFGADLARYFSPVP